MGNDAEYGAISPADNERTTGPKKASVMTVVYYIVAFIITGTFGVVISKIMMQTKVVGLPGSKPHFFEKPWYINWLMFVGMILCIVQDVIEKFFARRKKLAERQNNIQNGEEEHHTSTWKVFWLVCIPGLCDLVATFLMNVGMLWTLLSVRGSIVVFTALIRLVWLKKPIYRFEWIGIFTVVVALSIVGYAGVLGAGNDKSTLEGSATLFEKVLGIILVIIAQAIQALQTVIEEYLLHDVDASVNIIVGLEGFWGMLGCTAIAMPIAYYLPGDAGHGIHEDTLDTIAMIENSPALLWMSIAYALGLLLFNIYGMHITNVTHSVTRNILEAVRTFFIWSVGILLHYTLGKDYGEAWGWWSYAELVGFGVLVLGLFVFYKVIRLDKVMPQFIGSKFTYPVDESDDEVEESKAVGRPLLESTGDVDAEPLDI